MGRTTGTRISPACDRCYAAALAKRTGRRDRAGRDLWDPHAGRVHTSADYWRTPLRWTRDALAAGQRRRVFCASMADIFDNRAPPAWRDELWQLVRATPALDWQILTKRPQNAAKMLPSDWGDGWPNVWLGTTTENQLEAARRIPELLALSAIVHFLSVESDPRGSRPRALARWTPVDHRRRGRADPARARRTPPGCARCATRCRPPAGHFRQADGLEPRAVARCHRQG
jgi:protein gp37